MASFLTEVQGFTPVIDVVVQDVGMMGALIYGVIFRHCEMRKGVCTASLQTIADKVGVSRKTVERHVKELCDAGYVEDQTPGLRNRPHTYADTGKVRIEALLSARTERPSGKTESPSESDTESYEDTIDTSEDITTPTASDKRTNGLPYSYEGWFDLVKGSKNKQAAISLMVKTLYPDRAPPNPGYVAKTAKNSRIKTYGRLVQLVWQSSSYRPTGDVMSYCVGLARGRKQQNNGAGMDKVEQKDGRDVWKIGA